jgi:hypothetical protein
VQSERRRRPQRGGDSRPSGASTKTRSTPRRAEESWKVRAAGDEFPYPFCVSFTRRALTRIRPSLVPATDLSRAQGTDRRVAALTHVCEFCDHKDEARHNIELGLGMLSVLTRCLQGAMHDDEVRMVCSALEMVLRASPRDVQAAYLKINGTTNSTHNQYEHHLRQEQQHPNSLLLNLLRVLERCESNALTHSLVSILNIAKIFFYLSRSPELRTFLCRQEAVLDSLERAGSAVNGGTIASSGVTDANSFYLHVKQAAEVRYYRMRTLANLANVDENKVLLLEHQGGALLESILRVSHWDADDSCRQYAASSLMDLASIPVNQVAMASNDKVLGTLVKMALVEKQALTREFVITALQNLAFCKKNRPLLVHFKDGVLLEALKQALLNDLDAKARRRAAGALTNLVCDETAESMGNHKGLLDALAIVATKDDNWDVQTRASLALTKIANCITVHMDCHNSLLDALVVASLSKANNSVSAVLRVKARNPENREVMARHPGIVDTLTDLGMSVGSAKVNDRDNAIRALMHLLHETGNRRLLCTKNVLDALVAGANFTEVALEEARDSAIKALERLATEHANRDAMARHPGLLTAVARAVEREAAWEESGRESPENGFLAKPLLMSLLVAM